MAAPCIYYIDGKEFTKEQFLAYVKKSNATTVKETIDSGIKAIDNKLQTLRDALKDVNSKIDVAVKSEEPYAKPTDKDFGKRYNAQASARQVEDVRRLAERRSNIQSEYNRLTDERARIADTYPIKATPQAPFVTDTNAWTKLALKVALKEAVKQGADKIAWTTGEQQNERYDLSKQVQSISYEKKSKEFSSKAQEKGQDLYSLYIETKESGYEQFDDLTISEVEGYVGKDIANKIQNNEGNKENLDTSKGNKKVNKLTGIDLKVGGKGMKGFYGSPTEGKLGIVGNVAKSLFKQEPKTVGIEGKKDLKNEERIKYLQHFVDELPQLEKTVSENKLSFTEQELDKAIEKGSITNESYKQGIKQLKKYEESVSKYNEYKERVNEYNKLKFGSTQHSIDITPELKASVEGGQPLFKTEESKKEFGGFETRDGKPIGFKYDTEKVARERFDISKLKKIGSGSDRDVYDLGNGKVLKVAKTARGLTQNIYEGDYYLTSVVPEVTERGLNYVVTENTPRIKTSDVVETFDLDGNVIGKATAGEMLKELQKFSQKDMNNHDSKLQDVLAKYGLQDIMSYEVLWNDFIAQRNWGYKDGKAYHSDGGTFGGVDMIDSHKGKTNLSNPEFRKIYEESKRLKKQFGDTDKATMYSKEGGKVEAQYRIESGKNIVEAIKDFNGSPRATVALTHEIMHPTVVEIINGAKEGNEVGLKHTKTIVEEFNKANPDNKITEQELIEGNDAFINGTTTDKYRAVQEFIAEAWERYHTEGAKGFSKEFQKILDLITQAFRAVYSTLTGKELTPELRKMFDEILGKETQKTELTNEAKLKTDSQNKQGDQPTTESGKPSGATIESSEEIAKRKTLADRIRQGKIKKDILMVGVPFSADVWNAAVEAVATAVELTGDLKAAIEKGVKHIRSTRWYSKLDAEHKKRAEDKFREHYEQNDYTKKQSEPTGGEVPPTDGGKQGAEGGAKSGKPKSFTARIMEAENTPQAAKEGIAKYGLTYEPKNQEEVSRLAKSIVEVLGLEDAVSEAQKNNFGGGVNTAVQTEVLNRLYEQGRAAKSSAERLEAAEKFAEVEMKLDEQLRGKGQDISQVADFYKKSPLGVKIRAEKERAKEFDKWAKGKEQSWDDYYNELSKEQGFRDVVSGKVKEELRKERAEQRKDKVKKVEETIDRWIKDIESGKMTFATVVPPVVLTTALKGIKAAYKGGMEIVAIIQEAVDYINKEMGGEKWEESKFRAMAERMIGKGSSKNALDRYKDSLRKKIAELDEQISKKQRKEPDKEKFELDDEAKDLIKERDAKKKELDEIAPLSETEGYRLKQLDKFRKKLKGLSEAEKDEVIRKSYLELIKNGALSHEDFRKIIATATGRGELTPEQVEKMTELVKNSNAVEDFKARWKREKTEASFKNYKKAQIRAALAARDLADMFDKKADWVKTIATSIQGSTLTLTNALVNNPLFNVTNHLLIRLPNGVAQSVASLLMKNKEANTVFNAAAQKEFFKRLGQGVKESAEQLVTGMNRQDYVAKEIYSNQIRPIKSLKGVAHQFRSNTTVNNIFKLFGGKDVERKEKLTGKQLTNHLMQIFPGTPAELIFRILNFGDKPMRFAAEGATAAAFAKELGFKVGTMDYKFFTEFPREEAYARLKDKLGEKRAAERADYIEQSIIQEGKRSTFQQDNLLNDFLNRAFGNSRGNLSGTKSLLKTTFISPYIKIPSNAFWSYYNLAHPSVALVQVIGHLAKAKQYRVNGDNVKADLQLREVKYWAGHATVGIALNMVALMLAQQGIITPSGGSDESKKVRDANRTYSEPNSIDIVKLWAWMRGKNPNDVKNGFAIPLKFLGTIGTLADEVTSNYNDLTPEQRENRDLLLRNCLSVFDKDDLAQIQNGIFANTSSIIAALGQGGWAANKYGLSVLNLYANLIQPAAIAQFSRAQLPYYSPAKADSFKEEVLNMIAQRSSLFRKITGRYPPMKLNIWGEPLMKDPSFMNRFMGFNNVSQDNFAQQIYEDAKKYNDPDFFPPAVYNKLGGKELNLKQYETLQKYVGLARKTLITAFTNDIGMIVELGKKYSELFGVEVKKKALNYVYQLGKKEGVERFISENPEFMKVITEEEKYLEELLSEFRKIVKGKMMGGVGRVQTEEEPED